MVAHSEKFNLAQLRLGYQAEHGAVRTKFVIEQMVVL